MVQGMCKMADHRLQRALQSVLCAGVATPAPAQVDSGACGNYAGRDTLQGTTVPCKVSRAAISLNSPRRSQRRPRGHSRPPAVSWGLTSAELCCCDRVTHLIWLKCEQPACTSLCQACRRGLAVMSRYTVTQLVAPSHRGEKKLPSSF